MTRALSKSLLLVTALSLPLAAKSVDLTFDDAVDTVNDAYVVEIDPTGAQGTGVLNSFVRIQQTGPGTTESGFNTDGTFFYDEKAGNFTHSITLGQIPLVSCANIPTCTGTDSYLEFILDNNENVNALISLDEMEVWVTTTGSPTQSVPGSGSEWDTLLWDLDGSVVGSDGDSEILMDYSLNSGSGQGDMVIYVPYSGAFGPDTFITLWSVFGGSNYDPPTDWGRDAGFEEWAIRVCDLQVECEDPDLPDVPEPSTMLLMGGSLLGLALFRRRKNNA